MIHITVNSKTHFLQENTVVAMLIEMLSISFDGIAVAVNQEIVPKENWETTVLKNNDNVLIIQATQGG